MYLFRVKDTVRDVACCRRRLCVILEPSTTLSESESEDHWRLVPLLFQILDHILDPEDQWSDFDYPCQLLLTQLTTCCKQLLNMDSTQALSESYELFHAVSICLNIAWAGFIHVCDVRSDTIAEAVPEDSFNVELAVKCIRMSSSEHTHHHAFLLLACAAKLYPVSGSLAHTLVHFPHTPQSEAYFICFEIYPTMFSAYFLLI